MSEKCSIPALTPEQRRVAAGQYDRANQVIAKGDFDYGIKLLQNCCKIDPGNVIYRKALRQTQRAKFKDNLKGSSFSSLTTAPAKLRLKSSFKAEDHVKVLETAEEILSSNPWDISTLKIMAASFVALDLLDLAIWSLEHARQKAPDDLKVNRSLARLYEKTGKFTLAKALWGLIRQQHPQDDEADRKTKDLAASETIAKGNYESVLQTSSTNRLETETDSPVLGLDGNSPLPLLDRNTRDIEKLLAQIAKEPRDPSLYLRLAQYYRSAGQWDNMRNILEKGVQATNNNFEVAVDLADADIQPFRNDLALTEKQIVEKGSNPELEEIRQGLLAEINNRELDIFRRKADRYPTEMSHRLEIGIRLLQTGQLEGAIQELQAARTDPRVHCKALVYLGFCFKSRNNWRLAQRNFEDALRNLPAHETELKKEILFQLAEGCANGGDVAAAVEWAYELANEDFSYKNIGQMLDQWQTQLQGNK